MLNVTKRSLAAGLAIAAAAVPSVAQARLEFDPPVAPARSAPAHAASEASAAQPEASAQPGFQWGDAGIGAAGAVALLGAGAAASGVARRRRAQRPIVG
jgi:hypothetical protein